MKGVGTVRHYSAGVTNILSQVRMDTRNLWQISCDTAACRYNVNANEVRKCKFTPMHNGLHSLVVNEKSANVVFGERLTDNCTQLGEATSYMCLNSHCNDDNVTGVTETEDIDET